MSRKSPDTLMFDTMRLEGALFVPDLTEKIAQGRNSRQTAADYRIPKGLKLSDEYGRAFQIALAQWKSFGPNMVRTDGASANITLNFMREFLKDALGYGDLKAVEKLETGGRGYPLSFIAADRVPVIIAPHDLGLDDPDPAFAVEGGGSRRKSPFQAAQELLNASLDHTWALVGNGRSLRLLRDAATLTRPAFLEFDLEAILTDGRYSHFIALWFILHASRAEDADLPCIWEHWRKEGLEQGFRVREGLRAGVTHALIALGEGFLRHPANDNLRRGLHTGELTEDAYFQQLLRLVYRFLFLFTAEERTVKDDNGAEQKLLHPPDDSEKSIAARRVYGQGYALRRLRDRALRRAGYDPYDDLFQGVRIVFKGLEKGEPRLALPALGGLFARHQCPDIDTCELGNRFLLTAMRYLRWSYADGSLSPVDYRNMGPEELGSVYESLLELVPAINLPARKFGFAGITEEGDTAGNARKTTGSYYTPDSLVRELVKTALDPVIEDCLASSPGNPAEALLSVSVIDPACGSGHFLLAAARRLAERLALLRAEGGAVKPEDFRHALREVIPRCIYGVDRNPLALELARTALWLEGYEPGLPLSFLDHHLVCGDALFGLMNLLQMEKGIPDAAFKPLSGDDRTVCKALSQANKSGSRALDTRLKGQDVFFDSDMDGALDHLITLEAMPDGTSEEIAAKESAWKVFLLEAKESAPSRAADLFAAAFLMPKDDENAIIPTTETLMAEIFGEHGLDHERYLNAARQICRDARVLHWPLVFAHIFAKGGFDCVLANPPWERIKLQEQEFFATRHADVAAARNKAERDRRIKWLGQGMLAKHLHPEAGHEQEEGRAEKRLYAEFITARRNAEAASLFAHLKEREGGRYPLTGVGDVNTYALFAETISQLVHPKGRAGFIVPTGIATDDSTKAFFASVAETGRISSLYDFENRSGLFPAVDSRMKFSLLTLGESKESIFSFFLTNPDQLADESRSFHLRPEDFSLINPNTRTCPVFRSRMDAELTKKIYSRVPVLIQDAKDDESEKNPWNIILMTIFHMSGDSHFFMDTDGGKHFPLYEAKMIHQFDHRWAMYQKDENGKEISTDVPLTEKQNPAFTIRPRYWVKKRIVLSRIANVPRALAKAYGTDDDHGLLIAFANWVNMGNRDSNALETMDEAAEKLIAMAGRHFEALLNQKQDWRQPAMRLDVLFYKPLNKDELRILHESQDLWEAADVIIERRSPRWLIGWRRNARTNDTRTTISSIIPRSGIGDSIFLILSSVSPEKNAVLLGILNSFVFDFIARQKVGGVNYSFYYMKQMPALKPDQITESDLSFIIPRVLELTYTAHDLKPWAEDLGYTGEPFPFDPDRRAQIRAELDAYYARLYGLTRDELRYILDPADVMGPDYPSETFRVLKNNEEKAFGEYRTGRLVLAAWDALEKGELE